MLDTIFAWGLILFAPLVFAYAGSSDLFNMRISNRVALIFLLAFPVFAYGADMALQDEIAHVLVGLVTLAIAFFFWSRGWIGGGDAKFAAVAAIWMGPELSLIFFALTSVYGAIMAFAFIYFRTRFLPKFLVKAEWAMRLYTVKRIPYGLALAAAGLSLYPSSDWMQVGIRLAAS